MADAPRVVGAPETLERLAHETLIIRLALDGTDIRDRPLAERKRLLAHITPSIESRVRLVEGVEGGGVEFFQVACSHNLEGIVAKWKGGSYTSGPRTSWLEVRNPQYSQWENRRELCASRQRHAANAPSTT